MALYKYVKANPASHSTVELKLSQQNTPKPHSKRSITKIFASVFLTIGSIILASVIWPILSHQLFITPSIQKVEFISPISKDMLGSNNHSPSQDISPVANTPQVMGADIDYTNARNWFPQAEFSINEPTAVYSIDIPAINITDAKIIVGGDDLNESLIHYPGTSKPGQYGAPVIFGHSILRQFYNPSITNPNRYQSIFSKIMTLKNGDRIYVNFDNIRYTYEVKDKIEVQPEDLFILEQQYNRKELKLITCTPEGTYLRRGVIIAQLVNLVNESN